MKAGPLRQRRPINVVARFTLYVLRAIMVKPKIRATATAIHRICHIADEYIRGGNSEESPIRIEITTAETNTMISVRRIIGIVSLLYGHTFSFNKPPRTAHRSEHD